MCGAAMFAVFGRGLGGGGPPSLFPHFLSPGTAGQRKLPTLSLRSAGPDGAGTPRTATFLRPGHKRHSRIGVSIVRGFVEGDAKLRKGEIKYTSWWMMNIDD